MRFPRHRHIDNQINLTPLIDVVFQLLVFFMLAGSMRATPPFPVDPASSRSRTFGDEREGVVLVRADGAVALNDHELSRPQLLQEVSTLLATDADVLIQIKADADAEAGLVIEVMEELRDVGVSYIVLLTRGAGAEEAP